MGTHKLAGFTIIEVVLFLAISGLLVSGLLIGSGVSIGNQRYKDAAETFKSKLQQQYADLSSVQNSRDDNWSCSSTASPVNTGPGSEGRGQSDCILVGKYVRIDDDEVSIFKVVGYEINSTPGLNDIDALKANYNLNVSSDEVDESNLEWGTHIAYPAAPATYPTGPRKMGILIVRSPDSGQIYTFSNSDSDVPDVTAISSTALRSMIVSGDSVPGQGARLICINSNGLSASNDRGVYLRSYAASTGAVELQTNDYLQSTGSSLRC